MAVTLTKRRFTVEEYQRMVPAGILSEDDRVELIRGEVVQMTPIGRRHAGVVDRLTQLLVSRLGGRAIVRVQGPLPLPPDSQPQPDLLLLRPCPDFYVDTSLRPGDVLLLIEVADTTAGTDRTVKTPLYAEAGIREVWLIDLAAAHVEVYRGPGPRGYRETRMVGRGQILTPEAFPDLSLTVDEILG